MDFVSSARAAENGHDGKGLLRSHLWYCDDLPRLLERIEMQKEYFHVAMQVSRIY